MKKSGHLDESRYLYLRAKRKGKEKLLNELCHLYGYNRKHLIHRLNTIQDRRAKRPGAKRQYEGKELLEALKRIWLATDQMCSKRLNDNAHVEQKNWSHVRHVFGYDRFGRMQIVRLMNDIYQKEWSLYQNHFMPNQKLITKEKINSKYRKKYEVAKTSCQRILELEHIDKETKM